MLIINERRGDLRRQQARDEADLRSALGILTSMAGLEDCLGMEEPRRVTIIAFSGLNIPVMIKQ